MQGALRLRKRLVALGLVAGIAAAGTRAQAQEFSADLVNLDAAGQSVSLNGKVFVSGHRVRIETADVPGGFFLVDCDQDAAYFVRPSQGIYMDAKQSSRLAQLLVPLEPGDPCQTWQAMARIAGAAEKGAWRCERIGPDPVAGRDALKYAITSPQGRRSDGWIDVRLGFLMRLKDDAGTGLQLAKLTEGPQPASLFELPSAYRKFDPLRLIEQIKKSDVWVEPQE